MNLTEKIKRIKELTELQLTDPGESKYTILAHTTEELGETARAMCIEDSSRVKGHKKLDEPASHESIDLLICAISLFWANGGKDEDIHTVMDAKLDKWERSFTHNLGDNHEQ